MEFAELNHEDQPPITEKEAMDTSSGAGYSQVSVYGLPDFKEFSSANLADAVDRACASKFISIEQNSADKDFLGLTQRFAVNDMLNSILYSRKLPQGGRLAYLIGVNGKGKPTVPIDELKNSELEESQIRHLAYNASENLKNRLVVEINPDSYDYADVSIELIERQADGTMTEDDLSVALNLMIKLEAEGRDVTDFIHFNDSDQKHYLVLEVEDE